MYEFTCMNSFEWILGRNKHFRKESHRTEAIASRRNGVLQKRFRPNRTALNIAHFNKIITNRKWILHLHFYNRGYNNASRCKVKWWCVYKQSDEDDRDGVGIPSNIIYWSCKILLIVSFWFWIFKIFLSFGLKRQEPKTKPSKQTLSTKLLTALQEWLDVTVDKSKAMDMADAIVAAVPAD